MNNYNLSKILLQDNERNINNLCHSYKRLEKSNNKPSFLKLLNINESINNMHSQFLERLKIFDKNNELYVNFSFKLITFNYKNKFYGYNFLTKTVNYNIDEHIKNKIEKFIQIPECQMIIDTYRELNKISKVYKSLKMKLFKEKEKDLLVDFYLFKEFLIKKTELNCLNLNNIEENKKYISIVLKINYFDRNFILEKKNKLVKNNRKEQFVFYFEKNKNYKIEDYIKNSNFKFLNIEYHNSYFYLDREKNLEIINNINILNNF